MVQANIKKLKEIKAEVKNHCLCLDFKEDKNYYIVIFPKGYRLDGVRASKALGKIKALTRILEIMESTWKL